MHLNCKNEQKNPWYSASSSIYCTALLSILGDLPKSVKKDKKCNAVIQTFPRLNASRQPLQNSCRHW